MEEWRSVSTRPGGPSVTVPMATTQPEYSVDSSVSDVRKFTQSSLHLHSNKKFFTYAQFYITKQIFIPSLLNNQAKNEQTN